MKRSSGSAAWRTDGAADSSAEQPAQEKSCSEVQTVLNGLYLTVQSSVPALQAELLAVLHSLLPPLAVLHSLPPLLQPSHSAEHPG